MAAEPLSGGAMYSPASIGGARSPVSAGTGAARPQNEMPFEDLVKGLLSETSEQQNAVQDSVKQLISGESDSIHDIVLTASQADLAFRLVMEIRNRLISSYQEIMRMQV